MAVRGCLGRLVKVDRKARIGRNPSTGESIKIAEKKVVKFRIAKSAKDVIIPPKAAKWNHANAIFGRRNGETRAAGKNSLPRSL